MGVEPTTLRVLDRMLRGIGWLVGGSCMGETFLAINVLSLNVLLVMDCVTV